MDQDNISLEDFNNKFLNNRRGTLMRKLVDQLKNEVHNIHTPDQPEIKILGVLFESKHIPIVFWLYKKFESTMKMEIDELAEELGYLDYNEGVISAVRNLESDLIHFI